MTIKPLRTALLASIAAVAAGCGGSTAHEAVGGSGDCAYIATFHGHTYSGITIRVAPVPGRRLGAAQFPPCDDTGGSLPAGPRQRVPVAEFPGVPSSVALVVLGQNHVLLVRDPHRLPAEVRRLMHSTASHASS